MLAIKTRQTGITIKGHHIPHHQLITALSRITTTRFNREALETALKQSQIPSAVVDDGLRQILQYLKRKSLIHYHADQKLWQQLHADGDLIAVPRAKAKTLAIAQPAPFQVPIAVSLRNSAAASLSHLACFAVILALISLNASFALSLGRGDAFAYALVIGFVGTDFLRPFLVSFGFEKLSHARYALGAFAIIVAFALAPLSILSSTTVISSALMLGEEEITQSEYQEQSIKLLQDEFERLQAKADQNWRDWQNECAIIRCGQKAEALEKIAQASQDQADIARAALIEARESVEGSDFLARAVRTYKSIGLSGQGRELIIPLLIALTLEIAAIFGPALLLRAK